MSAKVIGFVSGKGGVGKTTCSVHVGIALSELGGRVLLIELDSGLRSMDIIAGISSMAVFDIQDVLSGAAKANRAMIKSPRHDNLWIIPAPYEKGHIAPEALRTFCRGVAPKFDYIVLDSAGGIGLPLEATFAAADELMLVVTPDRVSLRDGRLVSDEAYAHGLPTRLIINRVNRELVLQSSGLSDLDEAIDLTATQLIGVIPESKAILKAAGDGKPLDSHQREQKIFNAIAQRIFGKDVPLIYR